jgi:valyl-tRNA synthetase
LGVPEGESIGIFIVFDAGSSIGSIRPEINNVYVENEEIIRRLARVSAIETKDFSYREATSELGWIFGSGPEVAVIYEKEIDVAAERERHTKELAKLEKALASAERQLSNQAFLDKAPPHVVEGLRKAEAENRILIEKTRKALDDLAQEGNG